MYVTFISKKFESRLSRVKGKTMVHINRLEQATFQESCWYKWKNLHLNHTKARNHHG